MFFLNIFNLAKNGLLVRFKKGKYSVERLEKIERRLMGNIVYKLSGKKLQELLVNFDEYKSELKGSYHYAGALSAFMANSLGIDSRRASSLVKFLEDEHILRYRCHQDVGELSELSINMSRVAKSKPA
jgi:hypothetical protein